LQRVAALVQGGKTRQRHGGETRFERRPCIQGHVGGVVRQEPGRQRRGGETLVGTETAAGEAVIAVVEDGVDAAEQAQGAADLQQQAVAAPGAQFRRDAIGPVAERFQGPRLGVAVAFQGLQGVVADEGAGTAQVHPRFDAEQAGRGIHGGQALPIHHDHGDAGASLRQTLQGEIGQAQAQPEAHGEFLGGGAGAPGWIYCINIQFLARFSGCDGPRQGADWKFPVHCA
jgi:hypothetical protein